ncbi:MAG: sodium-independent anion transporter, partial [Pseudomonadota bacterium]
PKVFILNMSDVPMIDSSGQEALATFLKRCAQKNVFVILCGLQYGPRKILRKLGHHDDVTPEHMFVQNLQEAMAIAQNRSAI